MSPKINQRCLNCGRIESAHLLGGRCPRGLTVVLDADLYERLQRTHHPRTLWGLLNFVPMDVFRGITINHVRIVWSPVAPEATL